MTYKMTYRQGKTDREHRFIAMEILGRELKANEVVHHIDGNKRNNQKENLLILTRSEHAKIHTQDLNRSIPILQMSREGKIIKMWDSATKAGIELGIAKGNICKCCKGTIKTAGGYKWKYAKD